MTDREMLEDCLTAFAAIPTSPASRKLLRSWGMQPGAYAGQGSHLLANYMCEKIREHLEAESKGDSR